MYKNVDWTALRGSNVMIINISINTFKAFVPKIMTEKGKASIQSG